MTVLGLVTEAHLHALFPRLTFADVARYTPTLNAALSEYQVSTGPRIAAFLAQYGHETMSLRFMVELWGPTAQQLTYEQLLGPLNRLGNTEVGDGHRYRGRGLCMLTGRANYIAAGKSLKLDLVGDPDQAARADVAFRLGGWFWNSSRPPLAPLGLNPLADKDQFRLITRVINGGYNGYEDRLQRWRDARRVLGLSPAKEA